MKLGNGKKAPQSSCETLSSFSLYWPCTAVRNSSFDGCKLQITNAAEEAVVKLFSFRCQPKKTAGSNYKSQITSPNFACLKLQITKKEGVNKKLISNGNEGIKLNEAIEEAKDAQDAEEADEADVYKEEARRSKKAPIEEAKEALEHVRNEART